VYEFNTDLIGSGENVKYKGLNTNSIKKLLIYEKETDPLMQEEILDSVIKSALIDDTNIDEMFVLDRYYLFVKIREATKGSLVEYRYTCSKCKNEQPKTIDLNNLIINKPTEINPIVELKSLIFEMEHPKRSLQKKVTGCINKKLSVKEKMVDMRISDIASYVKAIKTLDGKNLDIDYTELIDFIGNLPENELDKINDWMQKYNFGIKLNDKAICKKCKNVDVIDLPITNFFS
jgi:hypothetical protein